jgi:hypothetical protein
MSQETGAYPASRMAGLGMRYVVIHRNFIDWVHVVWSRVVGVVFVLGCDELCSM